MAKIYVAYHKCYQAVETRLGAFDTDQIRADIPEFSNHTDEQLVALLRGTAYAAYQAEEIEELRHHCKDDMWEDLDVSLDKNKLGFHKVSDWHFEPPKNMPESTRLSDMLENPPSIVMHPCEVEELLEEVSNG